MNITKRYKRLTFWNKIAFWGSVASIIGFFLFIISHYCGPTKKNQEKILEETKKQTHLLERMQQIDETEHEKLIQTYHLGYVLFAIIDGDEIITQSTNRLQKGWRVAWNSAKIVTINEKRISLMHPGFYSKDSKRAIVGNIIGIPRKKGTVNPVIKAFGIELFCGVLVDDSTGIICLLGLKSA